jgi:hypothetical protein
MLTPGVDVVGVELGGYVAPRGWCKRAPVGECEPGPTGAAVGGRVGHPLLTLGHGWSGRNYPFEGMLAWSGGEGIGCAPGLLPPRLSITPTYNSCGRTTLSETLENLLAKHFIARRDVKAVQFSDGTWMPHTETRKRDGKRIPWDRPSLADHISGNKTYGHYLLNTDDQCKFFAFDIDLEENGDPEKEKEPYVGHWVDGDGGVHEFDAREAWTNRAHPSRLWTKYQLKMVASRLAAVITGDLELPCAVTYSGSKGLHVYGFTGLISAEDAREGAQIVLDTMGGWQPKRGKHFFESIERDPMIGYPNLSIEVFPKQTSIKDKDLGNLMRLPLGKNLKNPQDPTFFVDMTSPMSVLAPIDSVHALTTLNPWRGVGE